MSFAAAALVVQPAAGGRETEGRTISWALKKKVRDLLAAERGTVYKEHGSRVSVCLVYPNVYQLGMANLGFQSVYRMLNTFDGCVCERAFLPSSEDIAEYERTSAELFSYETQTPVRDFDVVAFSIPFENDYLNIPAVLKLAGLPVFASERTSGPLVIAGGVGISLNPEPVADFMDLFVIGEGEGSLAPLLEAFRRFKEDGGRARADALREFDSLEFVYVPSLYEFSYDGARITGITPLEGAKKKVRAKKNLDLSAFELPENFIITPEAEFAGAHLVEVERGCPRGCRFCSAGFLYLPPRNRDLDGVKESVPRGVERAGKAGLVGAAVSEYPGIKDVLRCATAAGAEVTLSSLRLDVLDDEFVELIKDAGYKTVTIAPEAGSERLRDVINKCMTDEEIIEAVRLVASRGFNRLKLYYLIGLPTEEDADIDALLELTLRVRKTLKKGHVTVSINPFIPKPFTPFQWHAFEDTSVLERRLRKIKKGLGPERGIKINSVSIKDSFAQAYIARADRRAARIIADNFGAGLKKTVKAAGALAVESVYMDRGFDEPLPWDLQDHYITKEYLWKEYQRGLKAVTTPPCDVGRCTRCGVC